MKHYLREPLLHFLLLGAVIFAAHRLLSDRSRPRPGQILVTQGQVEALATVFARTWQRPPTASELDSLVRDHIRDEVCAREAMAMGLDQEDTVIRRRLRQKLEFVATDLSDEAEATDDQLRAYLAAHADTFRTEPRFWFQHVYVKPGRDATAVLAQLARPGTPADAAAPGDPLPLDRRFEGVSAADVARQFGQGFAADLATLPTGRWQGPIESSYGRHLVWVSARTEGGLPPLDEVRGTVRREWANAQRLAAKEAFYQTLLKRYTVTVERPPTANTDRQVAQR